MSFVRLFNGLQIHTTPEIPRIKISDSCPISDGCRRDMNNWLVAMFGYKESILPRGQCYKFGNSIIMHPEDAIRLSNLGDLT